MAETLDVVPMCSVLVPVDGLAVDDLIEVSVAVVLVSMLTVPVEEGVAVAEEGSTADRDGAEGGFEVGYAVAVAVGMAVWSSQLWHMAGHSFLTS